MPHKTPLADFLALNPYPHPHTLGFFYREKMRAIHQVAPDEPVGRILEVGGGRSGLSAMLYPEARIVNLDMNPEYASAPCNKQEKIEFVVGDATDLPFEDESFDAITMFDLLEHVPDHRRAVSEALRVLPPGGHLLISSPNQHWRFPYYGFLKPICPTEEDMFEEWGHVRRGYSLEQLQDLIGLTCQCHATFITPVTVLCHDVAFSNLPHRVRRLLCDALRPVTWIGYSAHKPHAVGTETASAWQKPLSSSTS